MAHTPPIKSSIRINMIYSFKKRKMRSLKIGKFGNQGIALTSKELKKAKERFKKHIKLIG